MTYEMSAPMIQDEAIVTIFGDEYTAWVEEDGTVSLYPVTDTNWTEPSFIQESDGQVYRHGDTSRTAITI